MNSNIRLRHDNVRAVNNKRNYCAVCKATGFVLALPFCGDSIMMASGRDITHLILAAPDTFSPLYLFSLPSLTSSSVPLCLFLAHPPSPALSCISSPFNYPSHRSHKSSPSLLPPCSLNLPPRSSFSHPPPVLRDRFPFFHFICWRETPCCKISINVTENRKELSPEYAECVLSFWDASVEIETETLLLGWNTLVCLPPPVPSPVLCLREEKKLTK